MAENDRLIREGNPPAGRIASPTPQYWNEDAGIYEKSEGANGAIFNNDVFDIRGLSTDTKPTDKPVGSFFLEIDTGDLYIWDGTLWNLKYEDIWSDLA